MKKIIIAGGTGFIGSYLAQRFQAYGFKVHIVSRATADVKWNFSELKDALEGAEMVLNLAGKNINCTHNLYNKELIINSRVDTTTLIGNVLQRCTNPPGLWVNASATGIYDGQSKTPATEQNYKRAETFLAEVVSCWEDAFFKGELPKTRRIALRTSVVLGANGGALPPLARLTKYFLGGTQGNGKQMFSWIHIEEYFRILLFLIENTSIDGVINCTSPKPVSNKQLMYTLRRKLKRTFGLPAPAFLIRIAAKFIGTEPDLLLGGSYVKPDKLTKAGYHFIYPTLDLALIDLLHSK